MDRETKTYFERLEQKMNGLVSKDDLKPLAIKDDLKPFATKTDLSELRESLVAVLASKADVLDIKEELADLRKSTDQDIVATMKDVVMLKKYNWRTWLH